MARQGAVDHTSLTRNRTLKGEAPEEIQTLQLQQDVSEGLVCLNNLVCSYVLLHLLPCSLWLTAWTLVALS